MTAESKTIGNDPVDAHFTRFVRNVVEIAIGIWVIEVDRGRNQSMQKSQNRDDKFDAARRPQQMSQLALGTRHTNPLGFSLENSLDGIGLGFVAERRTGAVH